MMEISHENSDFVSKEQIDTLRNLINERVNKYRTKRNKNKTGAFVVQSLIILSSFATTVLIGWKLKNDSEYKELLMSFALVLSALVTALTTLDKFFDYKAFWVDYNVSVAGLNLILRKLEYLESFGDITRKQLDDLYNMFELVCSNMDKNYREIRSSRDE